ncbi:hypothetical protein NDU88_010590 [Pleurodeles waltl]|uniref:PiggyBac transposable element-derived protein domain-containing protein n=1 Tax=Pleurodeles waltl TaxID=8319 RepID=A0AAV7S4F5_PLEWA|nr:hypothetical protein NDU88_010590 [Pleurodeles waltl]
MEGQSTFKKIGGPSTSNKSGVVCGTRKSSVLCSTNGLGNPSSREQTGTLDLEFGDQDDDEDMYDEYVLDLDQGELDTKELFNDESSPSTSKDMIKNPLVEEMLSPYNIRHPRSSEWLCMEHVGNFIKKWITNPLEDARNLLRTECPRPVIDDKVSNSPNLDPELTTFHFKMERDPREGMEGVPETLSRLSSERSWSPGKVNR